MIPGVVDSSGGKTLLALTDNFNRSDSTTISTATQKWQELRGDWSISSNQLATATSPSSYPMAVLSTNTRNATVSVGAPTSGLGYGLAVWVIDSDNWFGVTSTYTTSIGYSCPTNTSVVSLVGTTCTYPSSYSATATTSYFTTTCSYAASGRTEYTFSNGYLYTSVCDYAGINCAGAPPWCGPAGYCSACYSGATGRTQTQCNNLGGIFVPPSTCYWNCVSGYTSYTYCQEGTVDYNGGCYTQTTIYDQCPSGGTASGGYCFYSCTGSTTTYSCPTNTGIVSLNGTTCSYPANYTATSGTLYNHTMSIIRSVAGTVTTVATSNTVTSSSASARPSTITAVLVGDQIVATALMSDASGTLTVSNTSTGVTKGKKHGVMLATAAGTQATAVDNFTYAP